MMPTLLQSAYLSAAKGDARAALTQAVSDAVVELRSRLEQAEQVVSYASYV
jgi:hypothetical protein